MKILLEDINKEPKVHLLARTRKSKDQETLEELLKIIKRSAKTKNEKREYKKIGTSEPALLVSLEIDGMKDYDIQEGKNPLETALSEIESYTHLKSLRKYRALIKNLEEITVFLKQLYSVIKKETGITKEDILSKKRSRGVSKNRFIMIYILRNRFPNLSTTNIGEIMKKDHATILVGTETGDNKKNKKQFDKYTGILPADYKEIDDAEFLYKDALKKYNAAHAKK